MANQTMSASVRQEMTDAAVMESLAENPVIEAYYDAHPDQAHRPVSLQTILSEARTLDPTGSNPYMQILQDYFKSGSGHNAKEYVIRDYDRTNDSLEANLMVTTPNNGVYVAFRGTEYAEGHDNAEGMYMSSTPQQREAREYFDRLVRNNEALFKNGNVNLVGHSKGGNEAMFVTLTSEYGDYIDSCVALDGQGYSPEAISYFMSLPDYEQQRAKISLVAGKYDYVHAIGIPVVPEENLYYVETQPTGGADSFASLHLQNHMFVQDETGCFTSTLGADTEPHELVTNLKEFFGEYMHLSQEQRKTSAHTVMQLLWPGASPDGNNLDPDALVALVTLFDDPVKGIELISSAVLAAWPQVETLGKILKAAKKVAEMAGVSLPAIPLPVTAAFAAFLFGTWATYKILYANQKAKEEDYREYIERISLAEAVENPEFYIDPRSMMQVAEADAFGRIGYWINDAQVTMSQLAKAPIPKRELYLADALGTGGALFDMNELRRLRALNDSITAKKKEIKAQQENYQASIEHLERIKTTLNAVLKYMSETGTIFANIEKQITEAAQQYENAARGKK